MKLSGLGPWGVKDVSRATGVPTTTLQRWHDRGWARASLTTGQRGLLRYRPEDVVRVCQLDGMREADGMTLARALHLLDRMQQAVASAMHLHQRASVSFAGTWGEAEKAG